MPRPLRATAAGALLAAATWGTTIRVARADPSCGPVHVSADPGPVDAALSRRVVAQVLTEIAAQGGVRCDRPREARIDLRWTTLADVRITVEIEGALPEGRAERSVELGNVSEDGRPLAIAIAADELLNEARERAAIAEAERAQGPAPEPRGDEPFTLPVLRQRRRWELGPALSFDTLGGTFLLGPDARVSFWATRHLSISGRLGVRAAVGASGDSWSAALGGASILFSPMSHEARAGVSLGLGADVMALRARRTDLVTASVEPSADARGWIRLAPCLSLEIDLGLGAALGGFSRAVSFPTAFASHAGVGLTVPLAP